MPLVRIDVLRGRAAAELETIGNSVQSALVECLDVPLRDRFQILTQHDASTFGFDRAYLEIERSDAFVLVQVTLSRGRSTEAKQQFYARLLELLHRDLGLRPEDLAIVLTENGREDWSFGRGDASYLVLPPAQWR